MKTSIVPRVSGGEEEHGHLEEFRTDPIGLMKRIREECGDVVGMESFGPFPSTHILEGQTEVLQPSSISKVDVSVRSGAMQQCRRAIRQRPEGIFINRVSFVIAG